jgi:hypothetical protein
VVLKRTNAALIALVLIPAMVIAGIAAWRPRETRALVEGLAKGQWIYGGQATDHGSACRSNRTGCCCRVIGGNHPGVSIAT